MYESKATSTEKCLAYAFADHLNCVTLDCWPAQSTLAGLLGAKSVKTVQRAARGLASCGLVAITVRMDGKPGFRYAPTFLSSDKDKPVRKDGQPYPEVADTDGRESTSHIQSESSSTSSSVRWVGRDSQLCGSFNRHQRGAVEIAVAALLGPNGLDLLSRLAALDDGIIDRLCQAHAAGALGRRELAAARLAAEQLNSSSARPLASHSPSLAGRASDVSRRGAPR
jgi:hypothetical protein